jgi:hypothetical protein
MAAVRQRLDLVETRQVVLVLPWDQELLARALDLEILSRAAIRRTLEIAVVSPDPEVRGLVRRSGFRSFRTLSDAGRASSWSTPKEKLVPAPAVPWWQEPARLRPRPIRIRPGWTRWLAVGFRVIVFLLAVSVVAAGLYGVVPSAKITLVPAGEAFTVIVPVYAARDLENVDEMARLVPARPVGLEVDGFLEVPTTGRLDVALGRTSGEVLFTNLLFQNYSVPAGTVVRTSSTSYPIRFQTTADLLVPAGGQATVAIESLADGVGNISAYQINQVEGIAESAVRVINPQSTTGSDATEVRVVTQADRDRARELLMGRVLEDAHYQLSSLDVLEPGEVVPRQSLVIQAVPKEAYTRFIGEQAESVGLELRLLVSGLAVDVEQARLVAQSVLQDQLPDGYSLVEAWFEVGDIAEEDIGPGEFTIFVTAHGYASAELDTEGAIEDIAGSRLEDASARLVADLPLAQPPTIVLWPAQMDRLPLLPLRIAVEVLPFRGSNELVGLVVQ